MADPTGSVRSALTPAAPAALEVRGASIRFGATQALDDVSLTVQPGSIHALVGQNGSGKSSLVKIITGVYRPARTTAVSVGGRQLDLPATTSQLARAHVGVVHQDMAIVPTMSVADNVMVTTDDATLLGWTRRRAAERAVANLLARLGVDVDPRAEAGTLSEAAKAVVAFARALHRMRRFADEGQDTGGLMILDEVTARLGPADSAAVLSAVRRLTDSGVGVLFVGHRLEEIVELCDSATVLRDGRVAGKLTGAALDTANLLHLATGAQRPAADTAAVRHHGVRQAFSARVAAGLPLETLIDAEIGEVVGVTGLADSGVDMLPYALIGRLPGRTGMLRIETTEIDLAWLTPARALRAGLGIIPGDRIREGVAGALSTSDNLAISRHALTRGPGALVPIRNSYLRRDSRELTRRYGVTPADPSHRAAGLSGGNQQKVLVARALQLEPRLLIAHEPTAGVDVVARAEIFRQMRQASQNGCVVLICSQDVDEVWDSCSRVLVLGHGAVVASFDPATASKDDCIRAVLSPRAPDRPSHTLSERDHA